VIRRDCRWHLLQGREDLCLRASILVPDAPLRHLRLGCDCDPKTDYSPIAEKDRLYQDPDESGDVTLNGFEGHGPKGG
jgi:hypothetical protein